MILIDVNYENIKNISTICLVCAVVVGKILSLIAFIPLVVKYKLYSWIPVICAGFVEVACWVITMHEGKPRFIIKVTQHFAELVFSLFMLPSLLFYKFYFTSIYFLTHACIVIALLNFIKEGSIGWIMWLHDISEDTHIAILLVPFIEFMFHSWRRRLYCFK